MILILIYVDDILIIALDNGDLKRFISESSKTFALKDLGILSYFFGIEFFYTDNYIYLSQKKYIKNMLSKANMLECKECDNPLITGSKLQKEVKGYLGQYIEDAIS